MRYSQICRKSLALLATGMILTTSTLPSISILAEDSTGAPARSDGQAPAGGGANTTTYDYSGTNSGVLVANGSKVTSSSKTKSTTSAQNTALVQNGGNLTLHKASLIKSGDDNNGDNDNFYGINSILLAVNERSKAYVSNSKLKASSSGSNGIFATDKATIYANKTSIATTADNSRGLDATYNGNIIANKMAISTKGAHSAAIATDRGGGNISTTNSSLNTSGSGSPLLYSTGNIQVNHVTGTSSNSQIAGMEGLNTILIHNSNLTSTMTNKTASDPIANGVIIYQSQSGDAEATTGQSAYFELSKSKLTSSIASGSMFYLTNTSANIILNQSTLNFDANKAKLLTVAGNSANNWGTPGSNGATVNFTGHQQTLKGDVDVDSISTLNMYLLDKTNYTGKTTVSTNSVNTSPSTSPITMNISKNSKWVLTGHSTVTNLNAEKGTKIVDKDGKTVSVISSSGQKLVKGKSKYSLTVTGTYSQKVTTSSSNKLSSSYIDRSGFDNYFKTTTAFVNNTKNTSN
ncbi:adhesin [Streptococcus mutans]|nr:adhesin [Streptococcus mutans]